MKPRFSLLVVLLAALWTILAAGLAGRAADPKKEAKNSLPGKATWDLRAFNVSFKVLDTRYDAEQNQVTWVLETKEAVRTSDLLRELDQDKPFTFVFYDEDMNDLATVRLGSSQFRGIPSDRIVRRGTPLQAVLDVPAELSKAKRVVLYRGKSE